MGDFFPYYIRQHPNARVFGRPTDGSFGGIFERIFAPDPREADLHSVCSDQIDLDSDMEPLHRTEQTPDVEVWQTQEDVIAGVGHDRRIGHDFLQPGPGWGGSCLPKDTSALSRIAADAGYDFALLNAAIDVNLQQFERIVDKVEDLVGGPLGGRHIAAWGLTFKANTDDLRDSPALKILARLTARGAVVTAYDPGVKEGRGIMEGVTVVGDAFEATRDAEALVVLTEWGEFRRADLELLEKELARPNVVDARNMLDHDALRSRGFSVRSIGRR